jgi:hypothetical protein
MASNKKKRKVDKRLHWGRGGRFLKFVGKGIKRLTFFTPSQRKKNNIIDYEAYSSSEFTCPEIVEWLKGVLESLYRLKSLEK